MSAPAQRSGPLRDVLQALGVGLLLGLSPLTGTGREWLSMLLGSLVAVGFLAVRLWTRYRHGPPPVPPAVCARPQPSTALALASLALVFAPTLLWLWEEHTHSVWRNVHGLFVPLFALLLARSRLRSDPHPDRVESSAWGWLPLGLGLVLALVDAGVRSHYLAAAGLLLCLPGVSLLLLGARRTRLLAVPLAFCALVLPAPAFMPDPFLLTEGTALIAENLLHGLGVPTLRHGTVFVTSRGFLGVSQNCSGLSALYTALVLAVLLAICARSWRRRLLLLALAYPVVLVLNGLRAASLVAGTYYAGSAFLHGALHGISGLAVLWGAIVVLLAFSDRTGLREALS